MNFPQAIDVEEDGSIHYRAALMRCALAFEITRVPVAELEAMAAKVNLQKDVRRGFRRASIPLRTLAALKEHEGSPIGAQEIADYITTEERRESKRLMATTRKQVSVALLKLEARGWAEGLGFRPKLFWITDEGVAELQDPGASCD